MRGRKRSRELFVTCLNNEPAARIYVCVGAAQYLRGPLSVLAGDGVVALVNDPRGTLLPRIRGGGTHAADLFAGGLRKFLTEYLKIPTGQRIPALYNKKLDGLVLGPAERAAAVKREKLVRVYPQQVRKVNCHVEKDRLALETHLPTHSSALVWGDMLALHRESLGQVVVESVGEQRAIRRPDVVEFCRGHWRGEEVYARTVGNSTVLSWDLVGLALLGNTKKFEPLQVGQKAAVQLRRDRSISLTPAAAQLLRGKAAVYVCGPTVALVNDPAGDVEAEPEGEGGVIHSIRLYWQIARCYPQANRLYFHAQGKLLVLSEEEKETILPSEEDFCRLFIESKPIGKSQSKPRAAAAKTALARRAAPL